MNGVLAGDGLGGLVGRNRSVLLVLALFALVFSYVNVLTPGAFSYFDLSYMLSGGGTLALSAMGQALVVLTGGFDLSAGAVISLVNVFVASTMQDTAVSQVTISILAILLGGAVGAFNGVFIAFLRMQPIVVTLSTLFIVQGAALLIRDTPGGSVPQTFMNAMVGAAIPDILPAPAVIIAIAVVVWMLIKNTPFGTTIYAIGSDENAAAATGMRTRLAKFSVYVLAGCFYGAAGLFVSAQTGGSDPLVGAPMLLQIFTAVVLGGTMLGGGRGGLVGPVIGAYLLMLFVNVLLIMDVPAYYSPIADGAVLLIAVLAGTAWGEGSFVENFRELGRQLRARHSLAQFGGARPWQRLVDISKPGTAGYVEPGWLVRNGEMLRSILPAFVALALVIVLTAFYFHGISGKYFVSLCVLSSFLAILAFGQGTVILTGGLDLSLPWTMALCAILFAGIVQGQGSVALWAFPLVLAVGGLIGFVNGVGITVFGLPPMVMTLSANGILQGLALIYSGGTPLGFGPPALRWLTTGSLFGITPIILVFLLFAVLASILLGKTPLGRRIYAVGNNVRVARLSGINVGWTLTCAYIISGVCSALVGILLVGFNGQANLGMGDDYLLPSIAVVVAGGTLITGGKGWYIGMIGGVFLLTALQILLGGTPLPFAARGIIFGLVVLGALLTLRER